MADTFLHLQQHKQWIIHLQVKYTTSIIVLPEPFWCHLKREVAWTPFLYIKPFFPERDWLENFQIFNFACEIFSWTIFFRNAILKWWFAQAPNKIIGVLPIWKWPPSTQFSPQSHCLCIILISFDIYISSPLITMLLTSIRWNRWVQIEI